MKMFSKPFVSFLSAITGALLVTAVFHYTLWGKETPPNIAVSTAPINRDAKLGTSFAPVIRKAAPSVVNIFSSRLVRQQQMHNPLLDDPMFRQFFGGRVPRSGLDDQPAHPRKEQSLGAGVIVSPNGYILTANHVVEGADEVKVAIADNKAQYTARVIGTDPQTDVAVLKIEASGLPAITLADSEQLEVGDVVLAIGNPFGIGQTVTMGIVSALGRSGLGFNGYENFIQTDAAINQGNSGGALVDAEGRLVGINTAIISRTGGNQGIGFAVPITMARHVMERLISGGKVTRGYLGVSPQDLTAGLAEHFNLPDQNGVLVGDVMPGTPAEKAGIKSGDIILAFNGKPVLDAHSLILAVSQSAPGSLASVKLLRNGQTKTLSVTLGQLPESASAKDGDQDNSDNSSSSTDALDGVTVADVDADVRAELKLPENINGAVVVSVDADSNSAEAALLKGDVILQINDHPVANARDAVKFCRQARAGKIFLKIWRRDGDFAGTRFLSVENPQTDKQK